MFRSLFTLVLMLFCHSFGFDSVYVEFFSLVRVDEVEDRRSSRTKQMTQYLQLATSCLSLCVLAQWSILDLTIHFLSLYAILCDPSSILKLTVHFLSLYAHTHCGLSRISSYFCSAWRPNIISLCIASCMPISRSPFFFFLFDLKDTWEMVEL